MKDNKGRIAYTILVIISFLFSYKYSGSISNYPLIIASIIAVLQVAFYLVKDEIHKIPLAKWISHFAIIVALLLVIVSYLYVDIHSLTIDRWSVISSFWEATFHGEYPYYAQSHGGNYPGPMPFYFVIALPFYLIGELSLLSVLGYILLIYLILRKKEWSKLYLVFYLILSIYMEWEIMTRSNVFTYSMLSLVVLEFYSYSDKKKLGLNFIISAVLIGLILSTRSVIALTFVVYFISDLCFKRISFKNLVFLSVIALGVFALTFIPIYVAYPDDFWIMNPFIIQSGFLIPQMYIPIFFAMALAFAFLAKDKIDQSFYAGLALFGSISIYAIYHIIYLGFYQAFLLDGVDLSYFILAVPFLLFYLYRINNVPQKSRVGLKNKR